MAYSAGSAKIDITPPLNVPYVGGQPRHSLFGGVHDRLHARGLAVTDVTPNKTVIMITVDALGINNDILGPGRDFTQEVRAAITTATGVPASNIMLSSSHAHSTPETGDVRHLYTTPALLTWVQSYRDQLAQAGIQAYAARKAVTGRYISGDIAAFVENRDAWAYPDPAAAPVDRQVGVLVMETADRKWRAVVVNFAAHPVICQVNPYVSADFPGVATNFVENNVPGVSACLFLQGATGNINPLADPLWGAPNFGPDNLPVPVAIQNAFAHTERTGIALGMTVVDLVNQPGTALAGAVQANSAVIQVPARDLPDRAPYQAEFDKRTQAVQDAINAGATIEQIVALRDAAQETEEQLAAIDRGTAPVNAEVQVLRIGNVAFAALPGEPFVELGLQLRGQSTSARTVVPVGYSNNYLGYFVTQALWDAGVWESQLGCQTRVGPTAGDLLTAKSIQLIGQLWP